VSFLAIFKNIDPYKIIVPPKLPVGINAVELI
jgi:hypothetical protein